MLTFIAIIHIIVAFSLIGLVLLQDSKGGAMGVFGGGSSSNVFGSTGGATFLAKATRYTAILFAATCIGMTYLTNKSSDSVVDEYLPQSTEQQAPVQQNTPTPEGASKTQPESTPDKQ